MAMTLSLTRQLALAAGLLGLCVSSAQSQRWIDAPRSFTVVEENDAFGTGKSDNDYTQGLRVAEDFAVWNPKWDRSFRWQSFVALVDALGAPIPAVRVACADSVGGQRLPCGWVSVSLGQTEYTPTDLTATEVVPTERPYAGYLWLGFTRVALYRKAQVTSEIDVGAVGPIAGARQTQSLAHWTWSSNRPQPQGWTNQLRRAPHVSLINQYAYRIVELCKYDCDGSYDEARWLDLSPRLSLTAGTLMTQASAGGVARLGYRMPMALTSRRIVVTRAEARVSGNRWNDRLKRWLLKHQAWVMGLATFDQHVVGHNTLLSGSWADDEPGQWRDRSQIETSRFFREHSYGIGIGLREATFTWQWVTRGQEYEPAPGQHRFGSITISVHQPGQ